MSNISNTRGNRFKMQFPHIHYNIRKYLFSNRIIAIWNSLLNDVVSVHSSNIFKNRLDKFWYNQDPRFNWRTDIARTGSRSLMRT